VRLGVILVIAAGCGRFGFSDLDDAGLDTPPGCTGHDEDADGTPDQCDLCPAHAGDQADADGDGVGDACDPDNTTAQRIVMFETFSSGLPAGWVTAGAATWTAMGDDVVGMYGDISAAAFVGPMVFSPPLTIVVGYRLVGVDTTAPNQTKSVVDAFDTATLDSQKCGEATPGKHTIGHEMAGTTVDATSIDYASSFDVGAEYVTTMTHSAAEIVCVTEIPALGPVARTEVRRAPYRTSGKVGLRIRSVIAAYHYVLVIGP
jgi:hypothetical protein